MAQREGTALCAQDAVDHQSGAFGRRAARRDDQARQAAIVLVSFGRARERDDRAVGKTRDAADLVARDAPRERGIAGRTRVGVGREKKSSNPNGIAGSASMPAGITQADTTGIANRLASTP